MKTQAIQFGSGQSIVVKQTQNAIERMRGLFGVSLSEVAGLWIIPCNSVHTIGMKYPLDLVYLDKQNQIVKLIENITAWRFSGTLAAHSVIEFAAGSIQQYGLSIGDKLKYISK